MAFRSIRFTIVWATIALAIPAAGQAESVRVLAAASMSDVINALAQDFSGSNPDRAIEPVFAGSGVLARQIGQGVPADVYISANTAWVTWLEQRGIGTHRAVFAGNALVWITTGPPSDCTRGRVAIADPEAVPAGQYARQSLVTTGTWGEIADRLIIAMNVRDVLGWVLRGHAPCGIVYATDALARPELRTRPLPPETHDPIRYEALTLTPAGATFTDYLTSVDAQVILRRFGFLPPPD